MVRNVINAITEALSEEFREADGYVIYTGDVPRGFAPGSFIVNNVTANRDKKSYSTYEHYARVAIQYNPLNGQSDIDDVVTRLQDCLEIITIKYDGREEPSRTEQVDMAVVDGILTYSIRVSDICFKLPQGDLMENIELGVTYG